MFAIQGSLLLAWADDTVRVKRHDWLPRMSQHIKWLSVFGLPLRYYIVLDGAAVSANE
jgi:hypothetical protein